MTDFPPQQPDRRPPPTNPFVGVSNAINNGVAKGLQAGADHAFGKMIANAPGRTGGIAPSRQFTALRVLGSIVR